MHSLDAGQIVIPLAILPIENDEDREFLTQVYEQYYRLLSKVAAGFFPGNQEEIFEAVGESAERMCEHCQKIKSISCNKRASYLVKIIRSVCINRLDALKKEDAGRDYFVNQDEIDDIEDKQNTHDVVFSKLYANDILDSFDELSKMDKCLIRMRHIDGMDYEDMAQALSLSQGAVRTGVSRAKTKLEKLARKREGERNEE